MSAPTDAVRESQLRRALGLKGMEVNTALTSLLAHKNVTLATLKLPQEQKPGEKPEERLRRFLDQIIRAQRRLGTPAWGLCTGCAKALDPRALGEAPWTETCEDCA